MRNKKAANVESVPWDGVENYDEKLFKVTYNFQISNNKHLCYT